MSVTDFIALHLAFLCVRKNEKEGERARTQERVKESLCVYECVGMSEQQS